MKNLTLVIIIIYLIPCQNILGQSTSLKISDDSLFAVAITRIVEELRNVDSMLVANDTLYVDFVGYIYDTTSVEKINGINIKYIDSFENDLPEGRSLVLNIQSMKLLDDTIQLPAQPEVILKHHELISSIRSDDSYIIITFIKNKSTNKFELSNSYFNK